MTSGADDLILKLSRDITPVAPGAPTRRLTVFAGLGLAISAGLMLLWLGLRPDLGQAVFGAMLWEKGAYTLALGLAGAVMVEQLSRPDGKTPRLSLVIVLLALGLLGVQALMQLAGADGSAARRGLVMGKSAQVCAFYICLVSAPVLALLLAAARGLAPTRLRLAGFAAGLAAGGFGAFVYSLHCPEAAAPFVAVWYSLGIAATSGLGALLGPLALRWR